MMPKVTIAPSSANGTVLSTAAMKASCFRIVWSDGSSIITASGSRSFKASAATAAAAGPELRPTGSSTIAEGSMSMARSCSAMMKRCSLLQTTIGASNRSGSDTRPAVSCSMVRSPASDSSCLG